MKSTDLSSLHSLNLKGDLVSVKVELNYLAICFSNQFGEQAGSYPESQEVSLRAVL